MLEASKQFAKEFMYRNRLPTAGFQVLYEAAYAKEKVRQNRKYPVVIKADGTELPFEVQSFRKFCLLGGLDDIGLTLQKADKIKAFEAQRLATKPWLAHTMVS